MADTLDLRVIHEEFADWLTDKIGRHMGVNVAAFPFSGKPAPKFELWPGEPYVPYNDPDADVYITIRGFLSTANAETAFRQMTDLLSYGGVSTHSIRDAIDTDPTLGGKVAAVEWLDHEWSVDAESLAQWFSIPCRIRVC